MYLNACFVYLLINLLLLTFYHFRPFFADITNKTDVFMQKSEHSVCGSQNNEKIGISLFIFGINVDTFPNRSIHIPLIKSFSFFVFNLCLCLPSYLYSDTHIMIDVARKSMNVYDKAWVNSYPSFQL